MAKNMGSLYADLRKYDRDPIVVAERAILRLTEEICRAMDEQGMTRAELARKAKIAPAHLTRVLSGEHNMTIETLGKIAAVLTGELHLGICAPQESSRPRATKTRPQTARAHRPAPAAGAR